MAIPKSGKIQCVRAWAVHPKIKQTDGAKYQSELQKRQSEFRLIFTISSTFNHPLAGSIESHDADHCGAKKTDAIA